MRLTHHMGRAAAFLFLSACLAAGLTLRPQQSSPASSEAAQSYRSAMEQADLKIWEAEQTHSEVVENEEYLTTFIGPRLTGSPAMNQASQWTLRMFRKYGLQAHLETTTIPRAWFRGNDWGEITHPLQHWMTVHSVAWGRATPGPVEGPLAILNPKATAEAIRQNSATYKGAIVLQDEPQRPAELLENPPNAYNAVIPLPRGIQPAQAEAALRQRREQYRERIKALAEVGALALLLDSGKPYSLEVTGGSYPSFEPTPLPMAYVSHSDYLWLVRLAKHGQASFRLQLAGRFSEGPAAASITVAEIPGTDLADQRVIIGGHLDSWDLGQGAVDNGTGAMATLEAARLLASLGWKPRRTLTFVLFTGEEQGGVGVQTFLHNHASELNQVDAVLIDDTGAGRIFSISLENLWATAPLMEQVYRPLQEVFDLQPLSTQYFGASDHVPFLRAGIPAYFCVQEPAQYGLAHHSQYDVFEVVDPQALRQQAAVLAAWMWNVSQLPEPFPHHARPPEPSAP